MSNPGGSVPGGERLAEPGQLGRHAGDALGDLHERVRLSERDGLRRRPGLALECSLTGARAEEFPGRGDVISVGHSRSEHPADGSPGGGRARLVELTFGYWAR